MRRADRERLERLYGDKLEPSPWPDDHVWSDDLGSYTERDFRLADAHLTATGERVDFEAVDPPRRQAGTWWRRRP